MYKPSTSNPTPKREAYHAEDTELRTLPPPYFEAVEGRRGQTLVNAHGELVNEVFPSSLPRQPRPRRRSRWLFATIIICAILVTAGAVLGVYFGVSAKRHDDAPQLPILSASTGTAPWITTSWPAPIPTVTQTATMTKEVTKTNPEPSSTSEPSMTTQTATKTMNETKTQTKKVTVTRSVTESKSESLLTSESVASSESKSVISSETIASSIISSMTESESSNPTVTKNPTSSLTPSENKTFPEPEKEPWRLGRNDYILDNEWDMTGPLVLRKFSLTVTEEEAWPHGRKKPVILVNGTFPGPILEANQGDKLEITIQNDLPSERTSFHFHGMRMGGGGGNRNNMYDGAYGVTQCGIPPGESLTYPFVAERAGTFWYRSTYPLQRVDGAFGALVVHGEDEKEKREGMYDEDRVVIFNDWYEDGRHKVKSSFDDESASQNSGRGTGRDASKKNSIGPVPDAGLINGMNKVNCEPSSPVDPNKICNTTIPILPVKSKTTTRLRLINASTHVAYGFSIDSHVLRIIEADGTAVFLSSSFSSTARPASGGQEHHLVPVYPGQRYSVLLTTDQVAGNYYMRLVPLAPSYYSAAEVEEGYPSLVPVMGTLHYVDGPDEETELPGTGAWDEAQFISSASKVTLDLRQADEGEREMGPPAGTIAMALRNQWSEEEANSPLKVTTDGQFWKSLPGDFSLRVVQEQSKNGKLEMEFENVGGIVKLDGVESQVIYGMAGKEKENDGGNAAITDLAFENKDAKARTLHFHGYRPHIIYSAGDEEFSFDQYQSEFSSSPRKGFQRDTFQVPGNGYTIVRFEEDNPGLWAIESMNLWQLEKGLQVQYLSGAEDIEAFRLPDLFKTQCAAEVE
ncbi:hypothetical protein MKZ38_010225 [Zalerion maritima]|uniref:Multicopper oxidase n=1 Tax=Zalerion maritima TaxID=339359 RepID=A0AAD5WNB6_9PEZI|nr:hypothetical protein MKZ38_010225 [Zalerion maritima]